MNDENQIKVWDLAVRIFHWSLVLLFTVSYLTGEDESIIHIYAGYGVFGLVLFRILWGFIGTKHARFSDFIFGPVVTLSYAKSMLSPNPKHYLGHNPLGGWMVLALLISIIAICWTGLEAYAAEGKGPLASSINVIIPTALADEDGNHNGGKKNGKEEFWQDIHEFFSNFTLFLIFLHITGVVVGSVIHKEKLVPAMITGFKKRKNDN